MTKLENKPLLVFLYPNNKYGLFIFKSGYTSTRKIFNQTIKIRQANAALKTYNGNKVLLVPVRNPIDRFESAVNTFYNYKKHWPYSVDQLIDWHEQKTFYNPHFFEVSKMLDNAKLCFDKIQLYTFPNHYKQMLLDGNYSSYIPHENIGKKDIVLTQQQIKKVQKLYVDDIQLYETIKTPGQLFVT